LLKAGLLHALHLRLLLLSLRLGLLLHHGLGPALEVCPGQHILIVEVLEGIGLLAGLSLLRWLLLHLLQLLLLLLDGLPCLLKLRPIGLDHIQRHLLGLRLGLLHLRPLVLLLPAWLSLLPLLRRLRPLGLLSFLMLLLPLLLLRHTRALSIPGGGTMLKILVHKSSEFARFLSSPVLCRVCLCGCGFHPLTGQSEQLSPVALRLKSWAPAACPFANKKAAKGTNPSDGLKSFPGR
jgi:hypothetical protein